MDWSFLLPPFKPVKLPSLGLMYDESHLLKSGWVNIRAYTVREDALKANINRENIQQVINTILSYCIQEQVDINTLTSEDAFYLLVWLRANSYNAFFDIDFKCPYCKNQSLSPVDLRLLEVNYLNEGAKKTIEIELPVSKLKAVLKCYYRKDELDIRQKVHSKYPFFEEEEEKIDEERKKLALLLRRSHNIEKITLQDSKEVIDKKDIDELCINYLHSNDALFIDGEIEKNFSHGVDVNTKVNCINCNKEVKIALPASDEFFRPHRYIYDRL